MKIGAKLDLRAEGRGLLAAAQGYVGNASVEATLTGLGFLSSILISRALGPEGRGQFAAAMMWPAVLGTLLSFGLQHATAYSSGVGWHSPKVLHKLALWYGALVGVPAAGLYWVASPWLFRRAYGQDFWIPQIFAVVIPVSMYVGMIMPIFQGRGDFRVWNAARVFRGAGWAAVVGVLAVLGATTVLRLLTAQAAILIVTGFYLAWRLRVGPADTGAGHPPIKRLFQYGFAVYLSGLTYLVSQQLDQLLLSLFVVPSELGYYATAASLSMVLLIVPAALGPVVFSKIARAGASHPEQRQHAWHALVLAILVIAPSGLLLASFSSVIVRLLYGSAFHPSAELMWILTPAVVFLGLAQVMAEILRGAGRPMIATYATVAAAIVTGCGLTYALPRYGVWGAASVSLASYMLMAAVGAVGVWDWAKND
jgi:O-antigen/teichoic acid export membrane protein